MPPETKGQSEIEDVENKHPPEIEEYLNGLKNAGSKVLLCYQNKEMDFISIVYESEVEGWMGIKKSTRYTSKFTKNEEGIFILQDEYCNASHPSNTFGKGHLVTSSSREQSEKCEKEGKISLSGNDAFLD